VASRWPLPALALMAAGLVVPVTAAADWLVLEDGSRVETRGPWEDRGATLVFTLANAVLLKADVTKNNADDRELLKRFQLFGPPGTIFYDAQGRELTALRVIGYQNTERFLETLRGVGL